MISLQFTSLKDQKLLNLMIKKSLFSKYKTKYHVFKYKKIGPMNL